MKPYPAADVGFVRMVFRLPEVGSEADRKVEIIVGKKLMVDCNRTRFGGNLERRVAEGWGYPYFVLAKVGGPAASAARIVGSAIRREARRDTRQRVPLGIHTRTAQIAGASP